MFRYPASSGNPATTAALQRGEGDPAQKPRGRRPGSRAYVTCSTHARSKRASVSRAVSVIRSIMPSS